MALQASEAKFDWLPTECAPIHFPVRLLRGAMKLADGTSVRIPDHRNVANGWGHRGSTHITDPRLKALPVSMFLQWFSWREDAFYEGSFDLPTDLISSYFRHPLARGRAIEKPEPFSRIIAGMAPEGFVSTWMDAGGEVVEISTHTAKKIELPWTEVTSNTDLPRAKLIAEVIAEKSAFNGISPTQLPRVKPGAFAEYHRRYKWKPSIRGTGTPEFFNTESFNGENSRLWTTGPAIQQDTRPAPSVLEFGWTTSQSERLLSRIELDENEVLGAFSAIAKTTPEEQFRLQIELTRAKPKVSVVSTSRTIDLLRTEATHSAR